MSIRRLGNVLSLLYLMSIPLVTSLQQVYSDLAAATNQGSDPVLTAIIHLTFDAVCAGITLSQNLKGFLAANQ